MSLDSLIAKFGATSISTNVDGYKREEFEIEDKKLFDLIKVAMAFVLKENNYVGVDVEGSTFSVYSIRNNDKDIYGFMDDVNWYLCKFI